MNNRARGIPYRAIKVAVMAALAGLVIHSAPIIQATVEFPPALGAYFLGGICYDPLDRCTQNAVVNQFQVVSHSAVSGNEIIEVTAVYTADIYTEVNGDPAVLMGQLVMNGTAQFILVGRNPAVNPLGEFQTRLADFAFSGALNGNTFELKANPAMESSGTTAILPYNLTPPIFYAVEGSMTVNALFSVNGGPFLVAPPRTAALNEIPEPSSGVLSGVLLAGLVGTMLGKRSAFRS